MKPWNNGKNNAKNRVPLLIFVAFLFLLPLFLKNPYYQHLFIMTYVAAGLGMSFNMVYSTRLITLGAAAFYAIGAYSSTLLTIKLNLSFWLALPLATVIAGIVAFVVGVIIIRTGTLTFVIMTLLFCLIIYQLVGSISWLGGWGGFINIPRPNPISIPYIGEISFQSRVPFYYLGLCLILLVALIYQSLYSSRIGRAWKAIKQSERVAASMGINVFWYKTLCFVVASSASGALGSFYAHYYQIVIPDMFTGFISIYIQIYSALGGLEYYILGPAVGAAIMIFVPELLNIAQDIQPIIFGSMLVIIIVFFPGGIIGSLKKLNQKKIGKKNEIRRKC